jgi:hypothetical protein
MATLSIQTYDETGTDLTMAAASAGGDQFANPNEDVELVIVNNDTSGKTVTVTAQNTSFDDDTYGESVKQDQSVTVSASGGVAKIGPFPKRAFNDGSGNVQITYSAVTSLEIAAVKRA